MHSSKELTGAMFGYRVEGQAVDFAAIVPDFGERARVGIVARTPGGALGASALLMAAITDFYDRERTRANEFFRYPDYFLFHLGSSVGPYGMLDIWPDHKEMAIGDAESLLRAINDRAITHLLVEETVPGVATFDRATRGSVGLRAAYAYAADGRAQNGTIQVRGNATTERYVASVIDALAPLDEGSRAALRERRTALLEQGEPVETYRRLTLAEALDLLAAP